MLDEFSDYQNESVVNDEVAIDLPQAGEIRKGTIASISQNQILISIGAKSEGVVSGKELEQLTEEERSALQVGQELDVFVVAPEDNNGNVVLSLKRTFEQIAWDNVEKMLTDETVFDTKIIGFNKGGVIATVGSLRGFIPSSQISAVRRAQSTGDKPEQRYQKMVGQPISVRIVEVDRERRRLILSERAAITESRSEFKEQKISELEKGKTYIGRVSSLTDYGAFVNVNGIDGLVHLSEISWEHIRHPKELLRVGQDVKVKIVNIDRKRYRIGLSIRAIQEVPPKDQTAKIDQRFNNSIIETGKVLQVNEVAKPITDPLKGETSFQLSRISKGLRADAILTASYLRDVVLPFITAIIETQHIIDAVKGRLFRDIKIIKISQNSPIETIVSSAVDAVTSAKEDIIPWRREHAQQMAKLLEQEKNVVIEKEKAIVLSTRASAAKDRAEEKKIQVEVEKLKAETERMQLENEKLRWELQQSKIQLGLDILLKINSNLSETQRIAFLLKLLEPLNVLATSELEILITE